MIECFVVYFHTRIHVSYQSFPLYDLVQVSELSLTLGEFLCNFSGKIWRIFSYTPTRVMGPTLVGKDEKPPR